MWFSVTNRMYTSHMPNWGRFFSSWMLEREREWERGKRKKEKRMDRLWARYVAVLFPLLSVVSTLISVLLSQSPLQALSKYSGYLLFSKGWQCCRASVRSWLKLFPRHTTFVSLTGPSLDALSTTSRLGT